MSAMSFWLRRWFSSVYLRRISRISSNGFFGFKVSIRITLFTISSLMIKYNAVLVQMIIPRHQRYS